MMEIHPPWIFLPLTCLPTICHLIRNAPQPTPSSSCESFAGANGRFLPSSPCCGRKKLKPPDVPLANITCEGRGIHCSMIMQSRACACETRAIGALPRSEVFVRFGVLALVEVLAFSGVPDRSDVLVLSEFGDWPRLDLADHSVLCLQT
jgi:hypothetical protein